MKSIRWKINRMKSMTLSEVLWRIEQKRLQKKEKKRIYDLHVPVTKIMLSPRISDLRIDIKRLPVNWDNEHWQPFLTLDLFDRFDYEYYKQRWNAGYQTDNTWPEKDFSYSIDISQRTDIGDIRTNWELNRHYQFAALAKSYYCTRKEAYLDELKILFQDWNERNLFLHGVEWTSVMEIAIRANSWVYTLAFLKMSECEDRIVEELEHGIIVMIEYITLHRARYSSANNHLIVEMYAVALIGILTGNENWQTSSLTLLTEELKKQNYSDGVNKEMSLHYQSFVMEAFGLLWLAMEKNGVDIPTSWKSYLRAMTEFLADSTDDYGTTMEFGDNDEGKILDLSGMGENYYHYVLGLMGCLLEKQYTDANWNENLHWIVPKKLCIVNEKYIPSLVCSRKEGGYTFLRSKDRRVLIGIDHAALGFGKIAAHGHADALSFQITIDGAPVFVDSGTYNYHFPSQDRNTFRSTASHNTIQINGQEQSEMLGPFIWGARTKTTLDNVIIENDRVLIRMVTQGKSGSHIRIIEYDFAQRIIVQDEITPAWGKSNMIISSNATVVLNGDTVKTVINDSIIKMIFEKAKVEIKEVYYSPRYNHKIQTKSIVADFQKNMRTVIEWDYKSHE